MLETKYEANDFINNEMDLEEMRKLKAFCQEQMEYKKMLNDAQKMTKVGSWTLDLKTNHLSWSDEIYRIFEIDKTEFKPSYEGFLSVIHPLDREKVNDAYTDSIKAKTPYNITHRLLMQNGDVKYVVEKGETVYDENGDPVFSQGTVQDITETRKLQLQQEQYIKLIDENIIISSTDLKGTITDVSSAFCRISGHSKNELIGKNHNVVRHPDMGRDFYKNLWDTINSDNVWSGEIKNIRKDGTPYWVKATISPTFDYNGKKTGYTAIRQDITDKKKVEELAVTDRLTGLYNRLKLDEVFEYELNMAKRYDNRFSVILMDMDRFKNVNDTFGHQTGDRVLQELAKLIRENIRQSDTTGRWGGEEFLIICPQTDINGAALLAEKLRCEIEAHEFPVVGNKTSSFGVASFKDGDDEDTMISRADEALYRAKENGRNQVVRAAGEEQ